MKKAVLDFISHATKMPVLDIKLSHRVEEDFGLAGLDTISFYEGFFEKFSVENPDEFVFDRHCAPEGLLMVKFWLTSIFSKKAREALKVYDVSIGHLMKVAQEKRWTDPAVEQELKLEDHQFVVGHVQALTGKILKVDMTVYIGEGDRYFVFDTKGEAIQYMTRAIEEDPEIECFMVNANEETVMYLDKNGTRRLNDG